MIHISDNKQSWDKYVSEKKSKGQSVNYFEWEAGEILKDGIIKE
jgi:hypothetical protein